jgi:hypothetical protein
MEHLAECTIFAELCTMGPCFHSFSPAPSLLQIRFGKPFELYGPGEHHEEELAILSGVLAETLVQRMLSERHPVAQNEEGWSAKDYNSSSNDRRIRPDVNSSNSSSSEISEGLMDLVRSTANSGDDLSENVLDEQLLGMYRYLQETR